jgi:DNA-binding GntR family transcriptional regulator
MKRALDHFMRYFRLAPQRVRLGFIDDTAHRELFEAAIARDIQRCTALARAHITVLDSLVESLRVFDDQSGARARL